MSEEKYVATVDQGTTGTRFIIFDHNGLPKASAYEEHEQIFPQPGFVEHNPEEIWEKTKTVIHKALEKGKIQPRQIQGIGITNQRETTVLWDRSAGQPLHNAIVWQCRRTADRCEEIKENSDLNTTIQEKTGLVVDAYFSATKLEWLLDHIPKARERAKKGEICFGTIDSWLIFKLTGGKAHVSDYSNCSRTMLFNIEKLEWDLELLEEFRIPEAILPDPKSSSEFYGETSKEAFHNAAKIPVCGDLGDQQAALFGQACFNPGQAKNTYGTGSFMLMNLGTKLIRSKNQLLTTIAWNIDNQTSYALEGSIFITGAAIQWLRDGLMIIDSAKESEDLASQVEDTAGVYFVPAFVGLGAPYWDQYARGTIIGITRGTSRPHLVRATLESMCFQTVDVAKAMIADSKIEFSSLRIDGGAVKNNLLCQVQADLMGIPVVRPRVEETTALGAAYAAGLACEFWDDLDDLRSNWQIDRTFDPKISAEDREMRYRKWQKAVQRSQNWLFPS
ncbi:MAG: glycerol kinase GlpK [Candidatus Hodarchaeales archaeon]